VDPKTRANRTAWEIASWKHIREYDDLLAEARAGGSLTAVEHALLDELLPVERAEQLFGLGAGEGWFPRDVVVSHAQKPIDRLRHKYPP